MSHKDAPPETPTQTECREWWEKAQPHIARAWGRDKRGTFFAEESRLLHLAWGAARGDLAMKTSDAYLRELAAYKQAVNEAMTGDWFECAQFIDRRARELLEDNP